MRPNSSFACLPVYTLNLFFRSILSGMAHKMHTLCRLSIQAGCEIVNVQREENYYIFPWLMNKYLKTVLPPGDASDCSVFFYNVKDSEKINST